MHIPLPCPSCGEECEHELMGSARNPVARCTLCGHVHREVHPTEEEIPVKVIVSCEGESRVCSVPLEPGETIAPGDRLAAECSGEVFGVEVTSIESKGRRVKRAKARDILTLWTRAIDEVVVRASVHKGWVTRPVSVACGGDEEFAIGESWTFGPLPFRITHMKLRDGRVLRREGQTAPARSVKRIYGYQV